MASNTISIYFDPCEPAPAGGYLVTYRRVGTSDFLTWPTNFFSSPAQFVVEGPPGASYEGFIRGDCGGGKLGVPISWTAENGESFSGGGSGSGSGSGSGPAFECPLHIEVVTESLGFNETSCEDIKYSLRLVDNLSNPVVNTGPPISVTCHADYLEGDCATPTGSFTAPGPLVIPTGSSVSSSFFAATAPDNIVSSFVLEGGVDPDTLGGCDILLPFTSFEGGFGATGGEACASSTTLYIAAGHYVVEAGAVLYYDIDPLNPVGTGIVRDAGGTLWNVVDSVVTTPTGDSC